MPLRGEHVGFLHRVLATGELTTRMAFEPTAQRREHPELPVEFPAQCRIGFDPDTVPSYAE